MSYVLVSQPQLGVLAGQLLIGGSGEEYRTYVYLWLPGESFHTLLPFLVSDNLPFTLCMRLGSVR
jgi:hypothetical protein